MEAAPIPPVAGAGVGELDNRRGGGALGERLLGRGAHSGTEAGRKQRRDARRWHNTQGLEGFVGKGHAPLRIKAADRFGEVLHHLAVFPLRLLHLRSKILDAAREHGQLVIARIIQLDRKLLRALFPLHLSGEELDAADNGAVDDKKHHEQHETAGQSQSDHENARGGEPRVIKRNRARHDHLLAGTEAEDRVGDLSGPIHDAESLAPARAASLEVNRPPDESRSTRGDQVGRNA